MPGFQASTAVAALIRVARPEIKRRHDLVAYAVHAYYLCQGYKLVNVGVAPSSAPPDDAPEVPIDGWNDKEEFYAFAYTHPSNELEPVVVKCVSMGDLMALYVNSLAPDAGDPRTMNIKVSEVTTDSTSDDITNRYKALESLLDEFGQTFGVFRKKEEQSPQQTSSRTPSQQQLPPIARGLVDGRSDLLPDPAIVAGDRLRGGGMHIGLNDPLFLANLRHPELAPGRGGMRYDPIAPLGMPGYFPDDFRSSNRGRFHPDVMPPGGGGGFDPDNMFG